MHISAILSARRPTFSLEFFPPKTEPGWERLFRVIARFQLLEPDFVSVTYGAGGTTRDQTNRLVRRIARETTLSPIPHLTCVCHHRDEVERILDEYLDIGISAVMALRGDPPHGGDSCEGAYRYAAELVEHIVGYCTRNAPRGEPPFGIGVAGFPEGHPATPNRVDELDNLKRKIDAGADYVCTQLFFDNRDFYDFRERCELAGITVPIVAGVMPVTSRANFGRLPSLALGARYPASFMRAVGSCATDDDVRRCGVDWAIAQCSDLIANGVDGIHFYTLNQFGPIRDVWEAARGGNVLKRGAPRADTKLR